MSEMGEFEVFCLSRADLLSPMVVSAHTHQVAVALAFAVTVDVANLWRLAFGTASS